MVKPANEADTRIALVGSQGRMGKAISDVIALEFKDQSRICATFDRGSSLDPEKVSGTADVILDVSLPAAAEQYLTKLLKANAQIPYVIGCTGWTDTQMEAVRRYAERACVVLAPNFSPGVNLFLGLIEQSAPLLAKWGYDVVVHETHHTRKVDAPSGTAKAIIDRLGGLKPQVHASRAGNIVGTHEVRFIGQGDILSVSHEALDRAIFARGAVLAARWARHQASPGLYSMKEVIFNSD